MMEQTVMPRPLAGTLPAIASKSDAHRLLICAALADMVRSLYHHLQRLAGKAQDHMSNYMKIKAFELPDGGVKYG